MKLNGIEINKENILDKKNYDYIVSLPLEQRFIAEQSLIELAEELKMKGIVTKELKAVEKEKAQTMIKENKIVFDNAPEPKELNGGIYTINKKDNNIYDSNGVKVASKLLHPIAIYKNIETGEEMIKCAFYNEKKWETFVVSSVVLAHNGKIVELAKKGIRVTSDNARLLVKYFNDILSLNENILPIYASTSKLGWHGEEFLPYDGNIQFDGEENFKRTFNAIREEGNYDKWLEAMYKVRKNTIVRLLHASSLASVLLQKLNKQPFVTMVWGETGSGKTVAAMTAMSIWGFPRKRSFNVYAKQYRQFLL